MFKSKLRSIAVALIALIALTALTAINVGCSGGEARQAKYFSRAQTLFNEGNIVKAGVEVRNALQIDSNHLDSRYLLALINERQKNWKQMFANLRFVVDLDPLHIDAHIKLGQMMYANELYDDALKHVKAVLAIEPNHPDAHMLKGSVFFRQGHAEQAINEAHLALAEKPGHVGAISLLVEVYKIKDPERALAVLNDEIKTQSTNMTLKLLKIDVLDAIGNIDDAVKVYHELIRAHPDSLRLNYRLVKLLEQHNRIDEAELVLRGIVKSKPENVQLKLWLAEFISNLRNSELAKTTLQAFIVREPEVVEFQLALGEVFISLEDYDSAKKTYHKIIAKYEGGVESLTARNRLVNLALAQNDREQAKKLLTEILSLEKENSEALITQAKLLMAENDLKAAITNLRTVVKNQVKPIEALTLLAEAHKRVGAFNLALDNYRQLMSIDENSSDPFSNAASIELVLGNLEEAERLLSVALKIEPENKDATRILVALYSDQQRWQEGKVKAEQLIAKQETQALGYFLKGKLSLSQKNTNAAIEAFEQTLIIEPRVIEALEGLVQAYRLKGDLAAVKAYVKTHIEYFPEHIHAYKLLSGLYVSENSSKAIDILEQAIELSPKQASLYRDLGEVYALYEKPELALSSYREGLKVQPNDLTLLLMTAAQLKQLQQYLEAEKVYEKVLDIHPNSNIAANNLAMLYTDKLESPQNLDKAFALTRKLRDTEEPGFLDTLGWVSYKLGRYEDAISYLKSAIAIRADSGVFHYHLAMTYLAEGKSELAKDSIELATAYGIRPEREEELRNLLANIEEAD